MELSNLGQSRSPLRRLLGVAGGRPLAILVLLAILLSEVLYALPAPWRALYPGWFTATLELIRSPLKSVELTLFDGYQKLSPRQPKSQPVTVVAIDEKSLKALGQWPWPRDLLADLVGTLGFYQPAAIGLDFYMPEADPNSIEKLAARLAPEQAELLNTLNALPSGDFQLATALSGTPSVLGAAGFEFATYTTSENLLVAPIDTSRTRILFSLSPTTPRCWPAWRSFNRPPRDRLCSVSPDPLARCGVSRPSWRSMTSWCPPLPWRC